MRKRLDLTKPVDIDLIIGCIDIAEQAPSGGNQGSRRWVVVTDPEIKAAIAELYMATGGGFMISARDRIAGTGHPQEKVMESAANEQSSSNCSASRPRTPRSPRFPWRGPRALASAKPPDIQRERSPS